MKRAKIDFEFQQKKITKLVKNEMKSIRRIERRNTIERQRRFLQILSVATSVLIFQRTFHFALKNIKRNNAALKIQKFIHIFFRARMQTRVDHVKTLLGMRVVMVISNLRAKVKKTAARVVTKFILAIPASTKALVALRLMRKRCIRIQRWWRSFLSCKISKIRSLLRRWCLIERGEHRSEIKKMVSNQARAERSGRGDRERERERDQMMLSLTLTGGRSGSGKKNKNSKNNKKNNTFQDNIEVKEQSKKLDRLANKTSELYQNQYGNNNSMMTTKKLLHRESREALNLSYLMESVIRPTMQLSQKWLDEKFMVQSASKMLLSIVAEKKEKKERKKKKLRSSSSSSSSGSGSVEKLSVAKKKRLKAAAAAAAGEGGEGGEGGAETNYSWEWDHWLSILKKFETIDIGMGVVIRSEIPFEMRVAIIKNMLEKERQAYVRRFVSKSVDTTDGDVRPLVSLHSIKFLRDNQLSVMDLFERQSQPVFKVFTSRTLSQNGIMMAIVQVLLHIKY